MLLCGPTSGPLPDRELAPRRAALRVSSQCCGQRLRKTAAARRALLEGSGASRDVHAHRLEPLRYRLIPIPTSSIGSSTAARRFDGQVRFLRGRATGRLRRLTDRTAVRRSRCWKRRRFGRVPSASSSRRPLYHQGWRGDRPRLPVAELVRNYSDSLVYEEAEGGARPTDAGVLVERDLDSTAIPGPLDIWRLSLDGRDLETYYFNASQAVLNLLSIPGLLHLAKLDQTASRCSGGLVTSALRHGGVAGHPVGRGARPASAAGAGCTLRWTTEVPGHGTGKGVCKTPLLPVEDVLLRSRCLVSRMTRLDEYGSPGRISRMEGAAR